MKHFRRNILKTLTSLALVIVLIAGMLPTMTERAYAAQYTVTYNANGGKNPSTGKTVWTKTVNYNTSLTATSTIFTKAGYELTGFYANGTFYSVGTKIRIKSNTTITAAWKLTCSHAQKKVVTAVNATCTTNGKSQVVCSKCNMVFSTSNIPALGHNWKLSSKGNDAGHVNTCTRCPATQKVQHTWQVWSAGDNDKHYVICKVCEYQSTMMHTYALSHVNNGRHYYTCTADGCNAGYYGSYCRDCIAAGNWRYLVDTSSNISSGQNLFLRYGKCPTCGVQLIEYGNTGFLERSDLGKTIVKVIELAVSGIELFVSGGKVVFTIRSLISMAMEGKSIYDEIKQYMADKNFAGKLSACNVEVLKNIVYINPNKDSLAYSIAKTYFAPSSPKNMKTVYDYSEIYKGVRH